MVAKRAKLSSSQAVNTQYVIHCLFLCNTQEAYKSNYVAEEHLEHKEQAPPTANDIVEYRANQ